MTDIIKIKMFDVKDSTEEEMMCSIIEQVKTMNIYAHVEPRLYPIVQGVLKNGMFEVDTICTNLARVTKVPQQTIEDQLGKLFRRNEFMCSAEFNGCVYEEAKLSRISHRSLYMLLSSSIPDQPRWNELSMQFKAIFHEIQFRYMQATSRVDDTGGKKRTREETTEDDGDGLALKRMNTMSSEEVLDWAMQVLADTRKRISV